MFRSLSWLYFLIIYTLLFSFSFYYTKKKKNQMIPSLTSLNLPSNIQIYIFDNGFGGLWYKPSTKIISTKCILCLNGFQGSIVDYYKHFQPLETLFPNYFILYLENPTFPLSKDACPSNSLSSLFLEILEVYQCLLRYKNWSHIGFFGFDFGTILQASLYQQCQTQKIRKPNWIFHCNGFNDLSSFIYFKIPWYLQFLSVQNNSISIENFYQHLKCPFFIVHCQKNNKISFIEAVLLYQKFKSKAIFVPIHGTHESFLLNQENIEKLNSIIQKYNILSF